MVHYVILWFTMLFYGPLCYCCHSTDMPGHSVGHGDVVGVVSISTTDRPSRVADRPSRVADHCPMLIVHSRMDENSNGLRQLSQTTSIQIFTKMEIICHVVSHPRCLHCHISVKGMQIS